MGLALQTAEMPHLVPVMLAPESSLTFLVDDFNARRLATASSALDTEAWLNALQRQAQPLVASSQGRADLAAWLALVEDQT